MILSSSSIAGRRFIVSILLLEYHQVVPVHDLHPQELPAFDLCGGEPGNAPRELRPVQVAYPHNLSRLEVAVAACDSGRQQAFAPFAQRSPRPRINEERAFRMMEERNPSFAPLEAGRLGHEHGALLLTGHYPGEHLFLSAGGDNERDA